MGDYILVEHRVKIPQGLLDTYIILQKALESVYRDAPWESLLILDISARITYLMTGFYSGTEGTTVKCGKGIFDYSPFYQG